MAPAPGMLRSIKNLGIVSSFPFDGPLVDAAPLASSPDGTK